MQICAPSVVATAGASGPSRANRTVNQGPITERRRRRLTQEDLAEQLGVTARYLGGIERAERNMTLDSVDALAQELGIDALDLLSSTPSEGLAQRP